MFGHPKPHKRKILLIMMVIFYTKRPPLWHKRDLGVSQLRGLSTHASSVVLTGHLTRLWVNLAMISSLSLSRVTCYLSRKKIFFSEVRISSPQNSYSNRLFSFMDFMFHSLIYFIFILFCFKKNKETTTCD